MSTRDIDRVYGDPELAWRVLGLLNVYRLLVPSILSVVAGLSPTPRALGAVAPALFSATLVGMFAAGVLCIVLLKRRWPDLRVQAYLHIGFDIFAVSLLLLSSGGVESGLGLLLIMPVGAISLLVANRTAVLVAAISALCILFIQGAFVLGDLAEAGSFTQAGILGAVVFIVALGAAPLADRLRESEALVRQRELDLANLAELSQYVVERLRESIIVVDEQDRVRLINESARQILSPGDSATDALLGELSPRLLYLLETWRQKPLDEGHGQATLLTADGMREIRPRFAPLGNRLPSPVIIFLEDLSQISARVEQTKLAALGRLSASIAHEIRNPVGAMSHAAQLLDEAEGLTVRTAGSPRSSATTPSG
jgi:two-component system, NtrC family, sensor histidine kinase PilS